MPHDPPGSRFHSRYDAPVRSRRPACSPSPHSALLVAQHAAQHAVRPARGSACAPRSGAVPARRGRARPSSSTSTRSTGVDERRGAPAVVSTSHVGRRGERRVPRRDVVGRAARSPGEPDQVVGERVDVQRRSLERDGEARAVAHRAGAGEPPGVDLGTARPMAASATLASSIDIRTEFTAIAPIVRGDSAVTSRTASWPLRRALSDRRDASHVRTYWIRDGASWCVACRAWCYGGVSWWHYGGPADSSESGVHGRLTTA